MSQSQARVIRQARADLSVLSHAASVAFPVPGAPTIVLDLSPDPADPSRWRIVRTGWEEPAVLLRDAGWVLLGDVSVVDRYPWSVAEALRLIPGLLASEETAVAAWRAKHEAERARAAAMARVAEEFLDAVAAAVPVETVPVVTLQQAHAEPDAGINVPAPRDVSGYGQNASRLAATVRDANLAAMVETDADRELLTRLGRSIPATTTPVAEADAETTAVIDPAEIRELAGFGDTTAIPVVTDIPPMPDQPPGVTADLADAMSAAS